MIHRKRLERLSWESLPIILVPLEEYSSLKPTDVKFWTGSTHLSFPVTLVLTRCLVAYINEFVAACSTCSQNKKGCFNHYPCLDVLGQTLPLTLSLVCQSLKVTVILTIIDRFSKAAHFVLLPKLPSALETTPLLNQRLFQLHGIPYDIVSD